MVPPTCLSKKMDSERKDMEKSTMFSENIMNLILYAPLSKFSAEKTKCRSD